MEPDHDELHAAARAQLLEMVRVLHRHLVQTHLPVRDRIEVRRDLTFLIDESHRHVFRPGVALEVCSSVLSEVSSALPEQARAVMLSSCAAYLASIEAAGEETSSAPGDRSSSIRDRGTDPPTRVTRGG